MALAMTRAMAHPVAYPMPYPVTHPKFCNFTNCKEKRTTYVNRDQALEIRAIAAIVFYQTRTQGSGSPSKSGPVDFRTKNSFPSFFVSEKGLTHVNKKAIYYFSIPYFCLASSQN